MWEYSDTEYIKVFRRMLKWEWYTDTNTKVLFLHCLLKANWRDTKWRGRVVRRGEFITSLPSLSKETGLTVQEVRTALNHLKSTGELTDKTYSKFRVITINSYDEYQTINRQSNRQSTGNQQATNRQVTADIINSTTYYKEGEEEEEEKIGPPGPGTDDDGPELDWFDSLEGELV